MDKPNLSIVILSYNVKDILLDCIKSIYENAGKSMYEIIVIDNASSDGSAAAVKMTFPNVKLLVNKTNLGFGAGNNVGISYTKSDYVLFLNPDTLIMGDVLQKSLEYMNCHKNVGALGCQVDLPNGQLDKSCHRGFPSPWNSFCYFVGLSKLFPSSKLFAGYTATYLDLKRIHQVDCVTGAFLMVRKIAGDMVGWWDEDYFWNGEDIEFCYSLSSKGWRVIYFPMGKILHFKGSSSGLQSTKKTDVPKSVTIRSAKSAAQAMRIFYNKHYLKKQPHLIQMITLLGISILERIRISKIQLGLKYE